MKRPIVLLLALCLALLCCGAAPAPRESEQTRMEVPPMATSAFHPELAENSGKVSVDLSAVSDNPAQVRIDKAVILRIIFVIGRRQKQRIKIDYLDPQFLQIIQLFPDPLQIPAVKIPDVKGFRKPVPVRDPVRMPAAVAVFMVKHIIAGIPVAEAVRKDLVHDGAFCPVRRRKTRADPEKKMFIRLLRNASFCIADLPVTAVYLKIIGQRLIRQAELYREIIKNAFRPLRRHRKLLPVYRAWINCLRVRRGCTEANRNFLPYLRLHGTDESFWPVRKKGVCIQNAGRIRRKGSLFSVVSRILHAVISLPETQRCAVLQALPG